MTYIEPFTLDLSVFEESTLAPKDPSDLADEIEKIRKLLEKQFTT